MNTDISQTTDRPGEDLLGYLERRWLQSAAETPATPEAIQQVRDFVVFCQGQLRANRPCGIDYLGTSVGLRYQNGDVLLLVSDPEETGDKYMDAARMITQPGMRDGKGMIAPSHTQGITGKR